MEVFVTGSESFIGRVLIDACQRQGWRVGGVDLNARTEEGFHAADISDPQWVDCLPATTDAIIHLAAVSRDADCQADVGGAYQANVVGTARVTEAAAIRQVPQVVLASSEWVYGQCSEDAVQRESEPIDATGVASDYALSKLTAEQVLRVAWRQERIAAAAILRFGIVYGPRPGNWSAVESIFHDACCRREIRIGSRRTARRFIEVRDVVSGLMAVCGQAGCPTWNLSGDRLVTLDEVVQTSFRILGYDVPVREAAPQQVSIRNPANDLIRSQLNWRPTVDLEAGLSSLLHYFQQTESMEYATS